MITAVIPVSGSPVPLSVKTRSPVPKSKIHDVMTTLSGISVTLPVRSGDVIIENVLQTGVDIVATRSLP